MRRAIAGGVLASLALVGCKDAKTAAPPSPLPTSTSPTPSATETPSPTPAVTPSVTPTAVPSRTDLADGRTYVLAKSIDTSRDTVVVDVVQFLTGAAAAKAAKEDGKEADNDYYVRNKSTRLRTLPFPASVPIVVNTLTADETGDATKDTPVTLAKFAAYFDSGDAQGRIFVLTIKDGAVTAIHEQYLP